MPRKSPAKRKGPEQSGPERTALSRYTVTIPTLVDGDGLEIRLRIDLHLTPAQAAQLRLQDGAIATRLFASVEGVGFELPSGILAHQRPGWRRAFSRCAYLGEYEDLRALSVIAVVRPSIDDGPIARGARGPGVLARDAKDALVIDAIDRIANGESHRAAVCAALADYEGPPLWSFESAEETLRKRVVRHLRREADRLASELS